MLLRKFADLPAATKKRKEKRMPRVRVICYPSCDDLVGERGKGPQVVKSPRFLKIFTN